MRFRRRKSKSRKSKAHKPVDRQARRRRRRTAHASVAPANPAAAEAATSSTTAGISAKVARASADVSVGNPIAALDAAGKRIGSEVVNWLRWLLKLADRDLSQLSDAAARDLGWEIVAFGGNLGRMPQFPLLAPLSLPSEPVTRDEIQRLQKRLSHGLQRLFRQQESWFPGVSIEAIELYRWSEYVDFETGTSAVGIERAQRPGKLTSISGGNRIDVRYHVRWPNSFWAAVASTLSLGAWWLRLCRRCGTLFVATKRQEYCRAMCSQAVRTERYRRKARENGA